MAHSRRLTSLVPKIRGVIILRFICASIDCNSQQNIVMWSFFSRDPSKDFGYEILEQIQGTENFMLWKLHRGRKKVLACFDFWYCVIIS